MKVSLTPDTIRLGAGSTLEVLRKKFYLPKLRVYIGDYDENFSLPDNTTPQYFEGGDSIASITLAPETSGLKKIRGIIEEYKIVDNDSIDSFRYPFEVDLIVLDTIPISEI